MESRLLKTEIEVTGILAELGLEREWLVEAVRAGEASRDECTPNDPSTAPGYVSFARTTRRLAEQLIPEGWTREDRENIAFIVSPDRHRAIVISTGDEGTGTESPVKTKHPKGSATLAMVRLDSLTAPGSPGAWTLH